MHRYFIMYVVCIWAAGCGGGGDDEPPGRGTAACRDYQDAVCDFGADRCHAIDRSTCDEQLRGIECRSDEKASACANTLNHAVCGQPVNECDFTQVADPAPAIAHCKEIVSAICDHLMTCGSFNDRDACVTAVTAAGLDCDRALAVSESYEQCLKEARTFACTETTPSSCKGVIRVLPGM